MQGALNVLQQFDRVTEHWSPMVFARVNDQYLKVAKVKGQLAWHKHDAEDELFWIMRGRLWLEFDDGVVELNAGDCYVVPRGVRHNPVAEEECWVVLVEPVTTQHTGDIHTPLTRSIAEQLS